uniref:Uncharacterized protein n=1 Tax=Physcomitrium patens TaxID=3218 RepID=A0A2K1K0C2_PHYPA|nr:hypothetical protein PHYPA_014340 [Physcomitrium patens]
MHFVKGYVVSASPPNSSPGLETYYCGSRKIEILMILMQCSSLNQKARAAVEATGDTSDQRQSVLKIFAI